MNRTQFLTLAGAAIVSIPFVVAGPDVATAEPNLTVTVANTSLDPVPTTAVGTTQIAGSVSVSNQPTVDARQAGAWSVSVAGTPSVAIANGAGSPVLVRSVDEAPRELYTANFYGTLQEGESNGCLGQFSVPWGKRLIVEHFTTEVRATATDQELIFSLNITNGASDEYVEHAIPVTRNEPGSQYRFANLPIKAYGGPGSTACLAVRRVGSTASGTVDGDYSITGYLIPAN